MINYHHPAAIGMCRLTGVVCPGVMKVIINRNDRIISIRRYSSTLTKGARSQTTTGLFVSRKKEGRWVMKFLLVVLAVHFVAELVSAKRKENKGNSTEKRSQTVFHPAEFPLR